MTSYNLKGSERRTLNPGLNIRLATAIKRRFARRTAFILGALLVAALAFWPARRARGENFVFYLPNQRKLIPVEMVGSVPYLPLISLLNLQGPVAGIKEKRSSLQVTIGADRLQFHYGKNKVEIDSHTAVVLSDPVIKMYGQWMVPVSFLSDILSHLAAVHMVYKPGSNRAFVGSVQPITYSVRLATRPAGARLIMQFSGRVTAASASTNGKWVIYLGGAAIQPLEPDLFFDNPYIKELRFDDQDGRPKFLITTSIGKLNFYPAMTSDHKELVADFELPAGVPPPPGAAPNRPQSEGANTPEASTNPAAANQGAVETGGQQPSAGATPLPVIALDAGHGGADSGAQSRDGVLEKNLDAALVQQIANDLTATHKFRVDFTRSGDADPSIEDRTQSANAARPAAFITIHAGQLGDHTPVVRVYTYQPPSPLTPASNTPPAPSMFVPWDEAQQPSAERSEQLAVDVTQALAQSVNHIRGLQVAPVTPAPVRQLRSIAAPAVAIEVGTLAPAENAGAIAQPAFQQQIAAAIASAIETFRGGR